MQELMLGYLLEALDDEERDLVEQKLRDDPRFVQQLEQLRASLKPLEADDEEIVAPEGLTDQTCRIVAACSAVTPEIVASHSRSSNWRIADVVVGAGVIAASALFFFPVLMQSNIASQREECSENLHQLGFSLAKYSENHNQRFPKVVPTGNLSFAGIYSVALKENGLLPNTNFLVCPSSSLAKSEESLTIPSPAEIQKACGVRLRKYRETTGGSYAYNIGYQTKSGVFLPAKNQSRKNFVIMADTMHPSDGGTMSSNHGGCGQNVLYEDGRVSFVSSCKSCDGYDDFFRNDQGQIAAGLHENDSVVAHSAASPNPYQVPVSEVQLTPAAANTE